MSREVKYAVGLWAFTPCVDRFCTEGYRKPLTVEEQLKLAGKVPGLHGVIMEYPNNVNENNVDAIKAMLKDLGLEVAQVDAHISQTEEFSKGALTSGDERIRRKAIELGKRTMEIAKEVGARSAGLWLGQDGYDYIFQADYAELWQREVEAIREIAAHVPSMRLSLEYKLKEPRMHMLIGSVGKVILLCQAVGLDNCGATLDFGHALMCKENPAESAVLLAKYGRLFNTHFNDCYNECDDDMIPGSIHIWNTLELLYWLDQLGYDGWYGLDVFPYREDMAKSVALGIENLNRLRAKLKAIDQAKLKAVQSSLDAVEAQRLIRDIILP